MKKLEYNYVKSFFEEKNYILLSKNYVNSSSKLEYFCNKNHKNLISFGNFKSGKRCPDCSFNRIKQTKLEKYGDSNYNNHKKIKETKLKRYGDSNYNNIDKQKETMLSLYGIKNIFQSKKVIEKSKKARNNDKTKEKRKQTKLERYGNSNYNNIDKRKETFLIKYGVDHPSKMDGWYKKQRESFRKTCLERYGVEHHSKNPIILAKIIKNSYLTEKIIINGITHYFQGAEKEAFLMIEKKYDYIETSIENIPIIDYELNGIKRKYFPDFYIESENLIVEVKSNFTYNTKKKEIREKITQSRKNGYNFLLLIKNYKRGTWKNIMMKSL